MTEKTIGQAVYERAREEWHKDYFADVNLSLQAFRGGRLDKETSIEIQRVLDHCYAKWTVLTDKPLARLILQPFNGRQPAIDIEIHWPPLPMALTTTKSEIEPWPR